jgi:hypothetical protein
MPVYTHATYAGQSLVLANDALRVEVHRRVTGWGWAEFFTPDGQCLAVLDHLGEVLLRDQEIPMRLEADQVERREDEQGPALVFAVAALVVKDKLRGTSFEPWLNYPLERPCFTGTVTLTLDARQPLCRLAYRLVSQANQYARYVRGPWLKVGEGSFGAAKTDGLLPGVEWLRGDEWSSGTDWFKDPWALRVVPHPHKVAAPLMAISHQGWGVGLAWEPTRQTSGWFNYRRSRPQPVFASPNFIDRRNHHLLGLMAPDVQGEADENQVYRDPPLELHLAQRVEFDAEVSVVRGDSLAVLVDWVRRRGLPPVPTPRWPLPEALDRIAAAYVGHLWHPGQGFGVAQTPGAIGPHVPRFAAAYVARNPDTPLARQLADCVAWCQAQAPPPAADPARGRQQGEQLLAAQRPDGSFPFDPQGRHYVKDDFVVATTYLEPMGLAGDTALDITLMPVLSLLPLAARLDEPRFAAAARRALDFCLPLQRPEGGDYWETPLHAPNLLAAGHAAVAYALGWRHFGTQLYRQRAAHWIRCLLPFTHLWEPAGCPMLYNTKPCLCASDWYFANWVRDHVQWEVLETFALAVAHGVCWAEVDPEIDWRQYQEGVTVAALRWLIDHRDGTWLPHNLPATLALYQQGGLDLCFADTHNSTSGHYGGMGIPPDVIAVNLLALLTPEGSSR